MNSRSFRLGALIFWEYLKRNTNFILLSIIILTITFVAQFKFNLFYSPNTLNLGLIGTYQEYDLPYEVTKLASDSLVKADENGRIKPNLVSGWEVNNDATIFKFKLKDGLKWADDSLMEASHFSFNIPNTQVSFPDSKTIQFNLKESYSPLPSLLVKPIFKKDTLLGTGPYKITKIEKSRIFIKKITLEPKDPRLPKIYIRFYPSEKVAIIGFHLGEIQALLGVSSSKAFTTNSHIHIKQNKDSSKIVTVLFQTKDGLLGNRSLRQALSYAIVQIAGEEVANNPYPHTHWVYNADSKKYLSNSEEAKEALARAKASLAEEKLKQEIILTTTPNLEEIGKKVVQGWKALGLDVKLRVESGIPQNFQALLITQSIPIDPDQYVLWHATQEKTNLTKYDSKRVDKDLEDGRKIITEEERREKYFDFQKTLLEDAPAVFLYFPKYNIAYLKKSEGLLDKVLGLID